MYIHKSNQVSILYIRKDVRINYHRINETYVRYVKLQIRKLFHVHLQERYLKKIYLRNFNDNIVYQLYEHTFRL